MLDSELSEDLNDPSNIPVIADWTLDAAFSIARTFENIAKQCGCHIALAGSVLHQGQSVNDLDLVVYPRSNGEYYNEPLFWTKVHELLGLQFERGGSFQAIKQDPKFDGVKRVYKTTDHDGRTIDLLFCGCDPSNVPRREEP